MTDLGSLATRLAGLAQVLTGDREAAADLVHVALITTYPEPDERAATAALVRAWLGSVPPLAEQAELPRDLESLRRSLDVLPATQRVAVALRHWSGLPAPEIAAILRCPEQTVDADLAAGVAALYLPAAPDEPPPTVDARLAAFVAAAGPPLVDLAYVTETARAQRRHRRRTAVVAAGILLVAATVAALLTSSEPEPAGRFTAGDRFVEVDPNRPVIDDRARRLTSQLSAAMDDVLPGVTDLRPAVDSFPPLEFSRNPSYSNGYEAQAIFGSTMLILQVQHDPGLSMRPCLGPDLVCTYRTFPDGTWAYAEVHPDIDSVRAAHSLTVLRPDGTVLFVIANKVGPTPGPPELSVEDLFPFATVFTY